MTGSRISMDDKEYHSYQKQKSHEFEALCKRCGACCGAYDGDPCQHLTFEHSSQQYYCKAYDNRLGTQHTINGKMFTCVSIRDHIQQKTLRDQCGYWSLFENNAI
jgi:hypothetical protein